MGHFLLKLATIDDIPKIKPLMIRATRELQAPYLTQDQVEASFAGMGLDTQLITDGTYFCVWKGEVLVGCGGWSRRATSHGGDDKRGRDNRLLDPQTERARIRAMYTHPDHAKQGIGRIIIEASEFAARNDGFKALQMVATLAGIPFYERCGYDIESQWEDMSGAIPVPVATMIKDIL